MGASIFALALQCLGVSWLEVLTARRLDVDQSGIGFATWCTVAKSSVGGEGSFSVVHSCHWWRMCICFRSCRGGGDKAACRRRGVGWMKDIWRMGRSLRFIKGEKDNASTSDDTSTWRSECG